MAELAAAAGLTDEAPLDLLDPLAHGLAVGDLGRADVGVDAELAHQAVDDDLEVQLAHAGDERLAGLLVGADAEGRVLVRQAAEGLGQLLLVLLGLGLDREPDDRLGKVMRSRITGSAASVSVSPVVVDFRPTAATMSPAETESTSSRWLACIISSRPTRSLRSLVAFTMLEPLPTVPEYTRM